MEKGQLEENWEPVLSKVKKAAKADKSTGMKNLCACGGRFDGGGSGRNFFAYNLDSKDDDELWKIA
ncbi:hypothetical protein CW676_12120 [Macrococcoides caseolyticum]|uniref:hypothetical protein n=1 Tax=Macrococcoides caseolyticum TaxID=69966 RepID=UPI000C34DA60|nr:hypothetical protein [Macrococcus caseolyticus]PKE05747.1 hypothetical protein CW692_11850 [Macrococcus caseolyticus]PKE22978.1 hypothetical protein CW689_11665 [Macrococcus caseolyticus]PKE51829.1 hypothetical protein CW676_12120 [Macrococcus caseolyticus]PKF37434.1 hypothetical protein CW681_12105 [Macrococcus caseolyticus]